jgi:hypothetical protein
MQLLVTGVRDALEAARQAKATPRFRRTADPSLFNGSPADQAVAPTMPTP